MSTAREGSLTTTDAVLQRADELARAYPETASLMSILRQNYLECLASLVDDRRITGRAAPTSKS